MSRELFDSFHPDRWEWGVGEGQAGSGRRRTGAGVVFADVALTRLNVLFIVINPGAFRLARSGSSLDLRWLS